MQQIVFSRPSPCCCPEYKDFYIQDRLDGKDVHGHDAYSYALFRRKHFKKIRQFRTRKQAYQYVSDITGISQWDIKMGSCRVIINDRDLLGVLHNGLFYRIEKRDRVVSVRPENDEQLTGWFVSYNECLAEAKKLIQNEEA